MSDIIISAENIGKRYLLNHQATGGRYHKFSDTLLHAATAPLRWLRKPNSQLQSPISQTEEFWALKDVSFEIKRGEVVGVVGRNGAGKSTLLKILSRITEPTKGRITLRGRVASLLEVGTGFHPELTGRENIYLNGAILGMRREEIKTKFDEIVAFAEIEKFLDTPVKRYSSGMYVRLAFAVAAHLEPEILIVDEVLAVGDAQFQKKCLGKMHDVAAHGRTVLFVSHNMAAVCALCSRAIILNRGQVEFDGVAETAVLAYQSARQSPADRKAGEVVRVLDDNVDLMDFVATPSPMVSGSSLTISLRFRAKVTAAKLVVGLQLRSMSGIRLAELDLRHPDQELVAPVGGSITVVVTVPQLRLVEGEYALSLFCNTGTSSADHASLTELIVLPGAPMGLVAPVSAEWRGFFEFPYQFEYRADREVIA